MRERPSSTTGYIEVITGCMFSGKSEELIRRLRRAEIARQRIQIFKPAADTRSDDIRSRDRRSLEAIAVIDSGDLRRKLSFGVQVVGIDEAQFFDGGLTPLCNDLARHGVRVIVAGLDMDFCGEPFGPIPQLMATAEFVDKIHAVCMRCGAPAVFSQRIAGGESQVQVGDSESYEARCRRCFEPYQSAQQSLEL